MVCSQLPEVGLLLLPVMTKRQHRTFTNSSMCFLNYVLSRVSLPGGLPETSAKSGFTKDLKPFREPFSPCLVSFSVLRSLGHWLSRGNPNTAEEVYWGDDTGFRCPTVVFISFVKHKLFPSHLDGGCHFLHRQSCSPTH